VNVCENAAQTEFENVRWNEGRRIVEIGFSAEQLKSCQKCKTTPLHLKDCVGEIRYGFGSILKIKCICSHIIMHTRDLLPSCSITIFVSHQCT